MIEIITMGSSMTLFTFTFVLLALIELGFGGICRNPNAYQGDVVSDPSGDYKSGEKFPDAQKPEQKI